MYNESNYIFHVIFCIYYKKAPASKVEQLPAQLGTLLTWPLAIFEPNTANAQAQGTKSKAQIHVQSSHGASSYPIYHIWYKRT